MTKQPEICYLNAQGIKFKTETRSNFIQLYRWLDQLKLAPKLYDMAGAEIEVYEETTIIHKVRYKGS